MGDTGLLTGGNEGRNRNYEGGAFTGSYLPRSVVRSAKEVGKASWQWQKEQ